MPITRFLRAISINSWNVFINSPGPVATIEASQVGSRLGYTVSDLQGAVLGEDTNLTRLANRLAEGEFDNDFRYEITANPEPDSPSDLYFVQRYGLPSQRLLESFTTDRPYDDVEAAREVQAIPMEERWAMYAERGW